MKICFLYGGQGSQKTGMGKDLYENYPVFKEFYNSLETGRRHLQQRHRHAQKRQGGPGWRRL